MALFGLRSLQKFSAVVQVNLFAFSQLFLSKESRILNYFHILIINFIHQCFCQFYLPEQAVVNIMDDLEMRYLYSVVKDNIFKHFGFIFTATEDSKICVNLAMLEQQGISLNLIMLQKWSLYIFVEICNHKNMCT